ncbi:MAG: hypothetical protein ISR52_06630 [Rhodospirillales bacterium]|nr:hypothetical protein [Rhodospirillales bacterium]
MQRADTFGFSGRLVTLGRYNLWFTNADFLKMAETSGFKPKYTPGEDEDLAPNGGMSSRLFFRTLGFSELIEIEYFDEAPGLYIFDLNSQETPEDLIDTADAVFDFGTSEHVFHTPRLLAHIGRMLRSGGIVAHHTPMNNQVNHGFYQFSPTLYADYYGVNGYETLDFAANLAADYDAPDQQFVPLDAKQAVEVIYKTSEMLAMNTFFARKTDRSTINVFPQQSFYQKPDS